MKLKLFSSLALLLALFIAIMPIAALASSLEDAPPDIVDSEDAPEDIVGGDSSPSTGDNSSLFLYGGVAVIAIVAAGSFAIASKKKAKSN